MQLHLMLEFPPFRSHLHHHNHSQSQQPLSCSRSMSSSSSSIIIIITISMQTYSYSISKYKFYYFRELDYWKARKVEKNSYVPGLETSLNCAHEFLIKFDHPSRYGEYLWYYFWRMHAYVSVFSRMQKCEIREYFRKYWEVTKKTQRENS